VQGPGKSTSDLHRAEHTTCKNCVINSRPLTAVSDDHRDPSPITPAHLTIGRPLNQLHDVSHENLGV